MSIRLRFFHSLLIVFLFAIGLMPLSGQKQIIKLTEGAQIIGEVVVDRDDVLFVDVGFDLISVPRDQISSMEPVDQEETADSYLVAEDIYTFSTKTVTQPIKELAKDNGPAVVMVTTPTGLGSGFIIHQDGYVVTNDHVIAGEHEIIITVYKRSGNEMEKQQYENVRIIATSPEEDLALLKIEDEERPEFPIVAIGDASELRPGQSVFAIGNPLGLDRSVSEGIISLKTRSLGGRLYIQQTAEISPGNSGGPLFNLHGEVIGVNNMKVVAAGAEGLGFAIPSFRLLSFLNNRDAFAFDPQHPNAGFRYNTPPTAP